MPSPPTLHNPTNHRIHLGTRDPTPPLAAAEAAEAAEEAAEEAEEAAVSASASALLATRKNTQ